MSRKKLKEALKNISTVENFTGIEAQNLRQLNQSATIQEIEEAERADRGWFKGYAETILTMV